MSMYTTKKNSFKDNGDDRPTCFEEQVKKKSLSIYTAATRKTPLLAKYLHKPVRLIWSSLYHILFKYSYNQWDSPSF